MYLSDQALEAIFKQLSTIHSGDDGKAARERTSALRYFLACSELLFSKSLESIDLSPSNKDNRNEFVDKVGNVVKLNDNYLYTNNFSTEFEQQPSYRVGNNFLTSALKRNGPYPGRPAPLLHRENEVLSIHSDYLANLSQFGDFNSYRVALALWLLRFESIEMEEGVDYETALLNKIGEKYPKPVIDALINNPKEITDLIGSLDKPFQDHPANLEVIIPQIFNDAGSKSAQHSGFNKIVYGAPGTGKSYQVNAYKPNIRTVFHQDYQNSDFVGSYRPYSKDDKIIYKYVPGPFIVSFINALKSPDLHHYLIIEEINRANASSVFGEAFQLLDRDKEGNSVYTVDPDLALVEFLDIELKGMRSWEQKLYIPKNLSILATMNSADQGVELLDSAFKRRWTFEYIPINFEMIPVSDLRANAVIPYSDITISWKTLAEKINLILSKSGIPEDRMLGQFFLSEDDLADQDQIANTICGKVFIYLWDDVLRHGQRHLIFDTSTIFSFNDLVVGYTQGDEIFSEQLNQALKIGS